MGWRSRLTRIVRVAAPIVSIVYPPAAVVVGEFLGFTGAAASVAGAATIATTASLATGSSPQDAIKSGIAAAAGTGAGLSTAEAGSIASGAASGAASSGTAAVLSGASPSDVLKSAATGGVIGGAAAGVTDVVKGATSDTISGTGLKGTTSTPTQPTDQFGVKADYSFSAQPSTGFTSQAPTTGGQGFYGDPNVILPTTLSQYSSAPSQMKAGADGSLTTRYSDLSTSVVPESLQQYTTPSTGQTSQTSASPQTVSSLSKGEESAIKSLVGSGLTSLLRPSVPGTTGASPTTYSGQPATGVTAGLGGARGGAGDVESSETGGKRRNVWNEASLRLTDALGI